MSPSYLRSNSAKWYKHNRLTDAYDNLGWSAAIATNATTTYAYTYTNSTSTTTTPLSGWYSNGNFAPDHGGRRRQPPREFNRYLNASDLLEEFIEWLGTEGVRQGEVMDLPIELFVKWVIVRACETDEEEPNVELVVPRRPQPRCLGCQRFMSRRARVPLHGPRCAERHFARVAA